MAWEGRGCLQIMDRFWAALRIMEVETRISKFLVNPGGLGESLGTWEIVPEKVEFLEKKVGLEWSGHSTSWIDAVRGQTLQGWWEGLLMIPPSLASTSSPPLCSCHTAPCCSMKAWAYGHLRPWPFFHILSWQFSPIHTPSCHMLFSSFMPWAFGLAGPFPQVCL